MGNGNPGCLGEPPPPMQASPFIYSLGGCGFIKGCLLTVDKMASDWSLEPLRRL